MEYLFRGKTKEGEWVEGDLQHSINGIHITFLENMPPTYADPGGDIRRLYFEVLPETVGMFTGLKGFEGDIVEVCIYLVSPENVDNDQHYRGVITFEDGSFKLKIFQYLTFTEKKSKWIPLESKHLPFYEAELNEDGTFTTLYFDFMAISENLGEFNRDDVEIVGNIHDNSKLLKQDE